MNKLWFIETCLGGQGVRYSVSYMLSFKNANAGDLYVNRRGSGYWRVICKLEGFRILESCM